MKQFAVIGLGSFGIWVLEELLTVDVEVLIIDKSEEVVTEYRNRVHASYVADAIREETIRSIIPKDIDAAIIDLGDKTDVSILVANYLKKLGVKRIIAKAESDEHGEILALVGASDVIYPNREAASRIMPPLLSDVMYSYLPISENLVLSEIRFPERLVGQTLIDAQVRQNHGLNVIAVKPGGLGEFDFVSADYEIREDDTFLVVGSHDDLSEFGDLAEQSRQTTNRLFPRLFGRERKRAREQQPGGGNSAPRKL